MCQKFNFTYQGAIDNGLLQSWTGFADPAKVEQHILRRVRRHVNKLPQRKKPKSSIKLEDRVFWIRFSSCSSLNL